MTKLSKIFLTLFCLTTVQAFSENAPADTKHESVDEFLEKFMLEVPEDTINPLFRQSMAVQRRSLSREGELILGFQPSLDINFGPWANLGMGLEAGYAISERFELDVLWVPYYATVKKSVAKQIDSLSFADSSKPDLDQAKKGSEYNAIFHWIPGYGKISFASNRAYRYDLFLDAIVGWLKFHDSASPKVGVGFGNSLFLSDNFSVRFSLWGSYLKTPDLKAGSSSASLTGEALLGFMFYL